jgi:hypothetical protein
LNKLPYTFEVEGKTRRQEVEKQRAALEAEIDKILFDMGEQSPTHLRKTVNLVLRQVTVANNADELFAWATSKIEGQQWAMQRLAKVARVRSLQRFAFCSNDPLSLH